MTTDIPKQNELIYPILKALQGLGGEASNNDIDNSVIDLLDLPKEILDLQYDESKDWIVKSRINFARSYGVIEIFLACGCSTSGSSSALCTTSGVCTCKPNIIGNKCRYPNSDFW